jgi:hypothetical protein
MVIPTRVSPITAGNQWVKRSSVMVTLINHLVIPAVYTQVAVGYQRPCSAWTARHPRQYDGAD